MQKRRKSCPFSKIMGTMPENFAPLRLHTSLPNFALPLALSPPRPSAALLRLPLIMRRPSPLIYSSISQIPSHLTMTTRMTLTMTMMTLCVTPLTKLRSGRMFSSPTSLECPTSWGVLCDAPASTLFSSRAPNLRTPYVPKIRLLSTPYSRKVSTPLPARVRRARCILGKHPAASRWECLSIGRRMRRKSGVIQA